MKQFYLHNKGQSLIEIIIAITIGGMIIGISSGAIVVTLRVNMESRATRITATLIQELSDNIRAFTKSDWHSLYTTDPKGSTNPYYLQTGSPTFQIMAGVENSITNNLNFQRRFYVENVCRSTDFLKTLENVAPCAPITQQEDPSTQKITVAVDWLRDATVLKTTRSIFYVTRTKNYFAKFSDWGGSSDVTGPVTEPNRDYSSAINMTFSSVSCNGGVGASIRGIASDSALISSTLNTQATDGAAFNTIMYLGNAGEGVKFQIATSSSDSGPWNFFGSDGSVVSYYPQNQQANPDYPILLNLNVSQNLQYIRYKVFLAGANSCVDDIILNWSP
ncbi:MAG: hypothetical protein A3H06_00700 [Candidatus Colwellbacteria bacterium RIFCSPLOWO2_12_FULL_44_13]|uniref:Uncharacterized protein n=1 Tax=Candidatus Colwellbacteria bacterium RIFCSPLOWO2_12_FULL_44_13 TaxID=1797694 RepID=A0A1G1ZC09_9BACT|nr:MAG: hypothetical protein A3H06_00700 [Candidatus Colwellbacteria bacterium RIFCSPLOWO2_12_FULL_44_13]